MATIMIKVTIKQDKTQEWVNPAHIIKMMPEDKNACTIISLSNGVYIEVIEHPEEIIRRINWAAAKADQVQCGLISSFLEREERMAEEKANAEGVSDHNPEG